MPRSAVVSVTALLACLALAAPAPGAAAPTYDPPPAGANDFSCQPSAEHPNPVVLLHGLGATMSENWGYLSPLLAERGYCVFAVTYGVDPRFPIPFNQFGGVIRIEDSAPEIGAFVERVLEATSAAKVDFVGHSEGTFTPNWWLKFLDGAAKVDRYVALTPVYRGTNVLGAADFRDLAAPYGISQPLLDVVGAFCGSCPQFLRDSPTVQQMNAGGAAVAGVTYTTIMTRYDEAVVPYTSGVLDAPNATNIVLQDVCPDNLSEHALVAFDPAVAQLVFNALDPAGSQPVSCSGLG